MAEQRMIEVALIDPPLHPMRSYTLEDGLEELIADIREKGQLQNIVVVDTGNGRYRLVAGSRRCAAFESAGWKEIRAWVYQPGEVDEMAAMSSENFHRTQLNPVEEALFYREYMQERQISAAEAARRTHRSFHVVRGLLSLLEGDPEVLEALRKGEINKAQAEALNMVKDEIGRRQGLEWAKLGHMSARQIEQWRLHREVTGISENIERVKEQLDNMPHVDYRTQVKCTLHGEYVDMTVCPPRNICDDCWAIVVEALQSLQQKTDH